MVGGLSQAKAEPLAWAGFVGGRVTRADFRDPGKGWDVTEACAELVVADGDLEAAVAGGVAPCLEASVGIGLRDGADRVRDEEFVSHGGERIGGRCDGTF